METMNQDIVSIYNRLNRYIAEAMHAKSANVSRVGEHDLGRIRSYLSAARQLHAQNMSEPQLDLVETHPTMYALQDPPVIPVVENESLKDIINLFVIAREELIHSQSARLASGLIIYDSDRFVAILNKLERYLDNYVAVATPLDFPESSPMMAGVAPGRRDINPQ